MYQTKGEAYKNFRNTEEAIIAFEDQFNRFLDDAESMSPALTKSHIRRLKRNLDKIDLADFESYLGMIEGEFHTEFSERAQRSIAKVDEFETAMYDLESSASPSAVPKPDKSETLMDQIRSKFQFVSKEYLDSDLDAIIPEVKKLERDLSRLDFAELEEGDYDEMLQIKNETTALRKKLIGLQKSEKYGPYLEAPLRELVDGQNPTGGKDWTEQKLITILQYIEDPDHIDMWEPAIKRIIAKKMSRKEFKTFWDSVFSAMSVKESFESIINYNDRNATA